MSVLGVAGAAAGFFISGGTPQGAMLGYSIGSGVDALVNAPNQQGPRLEDLEVQMSSYGAPIPHEWGINRHAGAIIWPKNLVLKESSETESAKGGPEMTTYSYSCSIAVLLCEGPIKGVRRVWANKKIIYDASAENTGPNKDPAIGAMRIYTGTETQQVDPLIEATDGPSPAYLGYAYVVFEDFALEEYANRPPQFEFEIVTEGESDLNPIFTKLGDAPGGTGGGAAGTSGYGSVMDTDKGVLWVHNGGDTVEVFDVANRSLLGSVLTEGDLVGDLVYSSERQRVYGGGEYIQNTMGFCFDPETLTVESIVTTSQAAAGMDWPSRPGTLAYVNGGWLLAASSGSHIYTGIVLWNPETGVFAQTDDIEGWWKSQAVTLADNRVALITTTGLLIVTPDSSFAYDFYSSASFGGIQPEYISEDRESGKLLVAAGRAAWTLDISTGAIAPLYATSGTGYIVQSLCADPKTGYYYLATQGPAGVNRKIIVLDPDTSSVFLEVPLTIPETPREIMLSPVTGEIVLICQTSVWLLSGLAPALAPAKIPLSKIVGDLCTMKDGLAPAQIDVAALTPLVDGYPLSRQMSRRAAIESLQPIYGFDAVENDARIQFVMRGGAVAAVITEEDRAAREFGSDLPDSLSITRAQDLELPVEVELEYPDVDADHLVGAQYSRRLTKDTRQKVNMQTAVVMGATKAKAVTEVNLYEAWLQTSFKWTTTRKFSHLLPADVVELQTKAATYRARITMKREQPNGVIEWEGKQEAVEVYTLAGTGAAPTNYVRQTIYSPEATDLELLDIPMLRDADNNAGFYVAMG